MDRQAEKQTGTGRLPDKEAESKKERERLCVCARACVYLRHSIGFGTVQSMIDEKGLLTNYDILKMFLILIGFLKHA